MGFEGQASYWTISFLGMEYLAKTMSKKKEQKSTFPRLWLFVLLILGALVLGDLNQRMADARRLDHDAGLLEAELNRLEEENALLEAEIAVANTEPYVERWAHQEARMVREGEVLVILIGPEGEERVSGISHEAAVPVSSNFEEWLNLILGR
jgi:cell division protein FtsB